jgi:hypothetical protein
MKCVFILIAVFTIASCRPHRLYSYNASMNPATRSDSLIYEDDSIKVKFTLADDRIKFRLDNKLTQGIRINWDEVSISLNGLSYRVAHKETGAFKLTDIQPVTSIPPKSYLTDGLIPTDKIFYGLNLVTGSPTLIIATIFPSEDYGKKHAREKALQLKGSTVVVYLPLYINNQFVSKSFSITINEVRDSLKPMLTAERF